MKEPRQADVDLIREQLERLGPDAYADPDGLRWQVTLERLLEATKEDQWTIRE